MKKIIMLIIVVSLTTGLTTDISAQRNKKDNFMNNHNRIIKSLNLNTDQEKKFNDIQLAQQSKLIEIKAEIEKNRLEIKKMINSDDINKSKFLAVAEKNNELRSQIQKSKIETWFNIYEILNASQKTEWKNHMNNFTFDRERKFGERNRCPREGNFRNQDDRPMRKHSFDN